MGRRAWLISHDQTRHEVAQKRAVANPLMCRELFPGKLSISGLYTVRRMQTWPAGFHGIAVIQ